jgi:complement component 1 Q subcomponent-binding protein
MALRNITRGLFQLVNNQRLYSTILNRKSLLNNQKFRTFASIQSNDDAYRDLNRFLEKEIQLEKSALKHPSQLPNIHGFKIQNKGPEITLTRQTGNENVTVKLNVTNSVNASESDHEEDLKVAGQQQLDGEVSQTPAELKSRPTFTIDINRGGHTLSFLCSYLPHAFSGISIGENDQQQGGGNNNEQSLEDFQIDEFAIHDGEWNESVYSADCAVIDGELYDKLLNLLEEHGIGEGL